MNAILEALLGKVKSKRETRKHEFWGLAKQIAEGKSPSAEVLVDTLVEAGKTEEDLRKAVALFEQRFADAKILADGAKQEAGIPAIEAKLQEEGKKLQAAEAAYEAASQPLIWQLEFARQRMLEASTAKQRLIDNCPDERLASACAEIFKKQKALGEENFRLFHQHTGELPSLEKDYEEARKDVARQDSQTSREALEEAELRLNRHRRKLAKMEENRKEIARLQEEENKLVLEKLKP